MTNEVIVLANSYLPIGTCTLERALVLIYLGKAKIASTSGRKIRSVNQEFDIPEVIVLPEVNYVKRSLVPFSRRGVYKRDNYTCQFCGEKNKYNLTLDHYIPKNRWDKISKERNLDYKLDSYENLITLCVYCNREKSNRLVEELGWELPPPKVPGTNLDIDWDKIFSLADYDTLTGDQK